MIGASMMFAKTNDGCVNLAHVATVKTTWGRAGKQRHILFGGNGVALGEAEDDSFDVETMTAPVVPASPGTTVILIHQPHIEGQRPKTDDVWSEEVPVIAWRCLSFGAFPITLDDEDLKQTRILHPLPNGELLAPGDQTFESLDQAMANTLRDVQDQWDRRNNERTKGGAK